MAVTLLVTYWAGILAVRWLILHAFALDRPAVVAMLAVPVVQAVVLAAWRGVSAARRRP